MRALTIEEFTTRFWARVDKHGPIPTRKPELGPCWVWIGVTDKDGYGRLPWKRKNVRSNRVAWIFWHGKIPDGMWVLHHCDNPPCVNLRHLFLGTVRDNVQDSYKKGRRSSFLGRHHTPETKRTLSLQHMGKRLSNETREKIRRKVTGKIRTAEQKLHYSAAAKKRWAIGGKEAFNL